MWNYLLRVDQPRLNRYPSIIGGEFESIRQEVKQNLQITILVTSNLKEVARVALLEFVVHPDALLNRLKVEGVDCVLYHLVQVELRGIKLELLVLYLSEVQQVIDKVQQHG
jgi:hypothetical protein